MLSIGAHATPPNTTITNTAEARFGLAGEDFVVSASHSLVTDNRVPSDITLSSVAVTANTPGGSVGQLGVVDPDDDSHVFAVSDPRFVVTGTELSLAPGEVLALGESVSIEVTVTDSVGASYTETFVITGTPPGGGGGANAGLSILQLAPGTGGSTTVNPAQCSASGSASGPFAPVDITDFAGGALAVPAALELTSAGNFIAGEPLFFEVRDPDANLDSGALDSVPLEVTSVTGDLETLLLSETSNASGIFVGYLQTTAVVGFSGDCVLSTQTNGQVSAAYTDPTDPADQVDASALVDPLGVVFESASGRLVNGTRVTLIDADSDQPAAVFGDDGLAAYPAVVVSGDTVIDAAGTVYDLDDGLFRFPFVAAGRYRLLIEPPNRFAFPSSVADAALQTLPGAPYALSDGSRGLVFDVPVGPAVRVDVPLDLLPITPTPSELELLALSFSGASVNVAAGQCFDGSAFVAAPLPTSAGGPTSVPGSPLLDAADRFARGEPVFFEVRDADQDIDAFAPDSIEVEVRADGGDVERVLLSETGASTGVFSGYVQTGVSTAAPFDCRLDAPAGSELTVSYLDPDDADDESFATAGLDAGFSLFASATGAPLSGFEVTLIDDATGLPASNAVFAGDGSTPYPVTLTAGGSFSDPLGAPVSFAPGSFRWPVILPGSYRLEISLPAGYLYPSAVSDSDLASLGAFVISAGSRGGRFDVAAGAPVGFDVPIDLIAADVVLTKEASQTTAAVGDVIQYLIEVRNTDAAGLVSELTVIDKLPRGLRFVPGSVRVDGARAADPVIAGDASELRFSLAAVAAASALELRYVAEVSVGTPLGTARNSAILTGIGVASSNEAIADVEIVEDLFASRTRIVGQVLIGACDDDDAEPLVGGRVLLETGSYSITDVDGRYHFDDLAPGGHVVQLDVASLPPHLDAVRCGDSNRFAGSTFSQFVDVQAGGMWRADFRLQQKPPLVSEVSGQLSSTVLGEQVLYRYVLRGGEAAVRDLKALVMLDERLAYVPGSASINGVAVADPAPGAALTFPLEDANEPFERAIEFAAVLQTPVDDVLATRATLLLKHDGGAARLPVLANELNFGGGHSERTIIEERAYFESADDELTAGDAERLTHALSAVQRAGSVAVDVVGHADSQPLTGAARRRFADNLELSEARANNVGDLLASALSDQAHAHTSLQTTGRGDAEPVASNATDAGRALNRRVDVTIVAERVVEEAALSPLVADSGITAVDVQQNPATEGDARRFAVPEHTPAQAPAFDRAWLAANYSGRQIVWPSAEHNPAVPAVRLAVSHGAKDRVDVTVNGELANPLTFEGTVSDHGRGTAVSSWRNLSLRPGNNQLKATVTDRTGTVLVLERVVHYSGAPVRAELVAAASHLVADGVEPSVLAVRLFDRDGHPARPGTTGEFFVDAPYRAYNPARHLSELGAENTGYQRYVVVDDGIAYIQLEPTGDGGEVILRFNFDRNRSDSVRARLLPVAREWVLVGYAEGTIGFDTLSGNRADAEADSLGADLTSDGRVAFYAKGQIKGDVLLTLAYDTDKERRRELARQIDPNQFYTLYGDGSEQRFDARSQRKLYVKLERATFSALFGDFDTRFDDTEYTRYSRTLNGLRAEHVGDRFDVSVFASEADQGLVRDELRGDGTSGLYRLSSAPLIRNSEQVRIVVRDRFRTERVLERTSLQRYLDYSIDYDRGTLLFKQPVFGQDTDFNPIFIEVEYETEAGSGEELIVGGRAALRLDDDDGEVAVTAVRDDTAGRGGELVGAHVRWHASVDTIVRAEVARSDRDAAGSAEALLAELEHQGRRVAGRVYARQQDSGFGLGQQVAIEDGTRKLGADGEVRLGEATLLRAELLQQTALESDGQRELLGLELEHRRGALRLTGGARSVRERTADGTQRDGNQLTAGVSQQLVGGRLTLSANGEVELGDSSNTDYPSRAIVGAEYRLTDRVSLLAEQELSWGDSRDTSDTRIGLSARPWTGADVNTVLQRRQGENGDRLFATTGLIQQWRHGERWLFDVGFDQVQTMNQQGSTSDPSSLLFNANAPAASGSIDNDFAAAFAGAGYRAERWDASARIEAHSGDELDKWNLLAGASRQLAEGRVLSSNLQWLMEEGNDGSQRSAGDLRVGAAWRPSQASWLWLARLDLVVDEVSGGLFESTERKLVLNSNANWQPQPHSQLTLQLGLKHVDQTIDGDDYSATTALLGAEYRRDLFERFDVGVRGAVRKSFDAEVMRYSAGLSVGVNPLHNVWLSLGYNVVGFEDDDFSAAEYTRKGSYLKLRLKLDQDLFRRFFGRSLLDSE